jgi:uncharacterized membrane protein
MNEAHLHIALNHFPIFGTMIAAGILFFGIILKNNTVQKVAYWLAVAAGIISIPVFFTGEGAEEIVEHLPGISKNAIEAHEEFAKITFALLLTCTAASAFALYLNYKKRMPGFFTYIISALFFITTAFAGLTANKGGKIRHTEFENAAEANDTQIRDTDIKEEDSGKKRKGRDH